MMDEYGSPRFDSIGNAVRRKRTQTSRRPKPELQAVPETLDQSPSSRTPPSDDASKVSSDENTGVDSNPRRKLFNLNQCVSKNVPATTRTEGEYPHKRVKKEDGGSTVLYNNGGSEDGSEHGQNGLNQKQLGNPGVVGDGGGSENKVKKVKLKVGGVTRTIQPKLSSHGASFSGSSSKSARPSDVPRPRPKLILQDNSDEDKSPPPPVNKTGLQGIPWKDFSRGGFSLGREDSLIGKMPEKNAFGKQGEKSERVRKSKRVPKKRVLDGAFDEDDDDEIRYLEKLKTSKVAAAYRDFEEESSKKHRSLSRVSKGGKYDSLEDLGPLRSGKDGKKSKSESLSVETDYEEGEELVSDHELEGKNKKKSRKDSPDSPTESKRETTLTSRQRALRGDSSSASGASQIEFPNGLPPAPPRKQKEKLTEVEQQLKKAEAAERRRIQNEKAARESEAEAIRKILGQDSSRKKREDKLKKRQEELAQEKAANAHTLAPGTIRTVMGPNGTVVTFAEDMGLPRIFDPKPSGYPRPRENCAGPSCTNPYKYRDSKLNLPLCSLQCYKAVHEKMASETAV